jgi:hypothetical protein
MSVISDDCRKLQYIQIWLGELDSFFQILYDELIQFSGFAFSNIGSMGEIHDASHENTPALFGFIHTKANCESLRQDITKQLITKI